jgi:hypothetical protein
MSLQPPAVLLSGPAGSGKTSSIATMVKAGIETFVIVTEPDGVGSLIDSCDRIKAPIDKLHWYEAMPYTENWTALEDMISKINSMDQKGLADVRDMGKIAFRPAAMGFLEGFRNFHCDRTGQDFGSVHTWDDTRCLAVDSLTGWSFIGFGATVGYKPTANPGEWGIAQNFVLNMLKTVLFNRNSYFVLTSHVEKEMDEMTGVKRLMVSTIGAKLAPKIPLLFSEVVLCKKEPTGTFIWSTLDTQMDLKNRALPNSAKISPDFKAVVDAHELRKKRAGLTPAATPTAAGQKPV